MSALAALTLLSPSQIRANKETMIRLINELLAQATCQRAFLIGFD